MVVVCGVGGRELAIAARDAGLPLSRVVVCRDDATAATCCATQLLPATRYLLLA